MIDAETMTDRMGMAITAIFIENSSSSSIAFPYEKHERLAKKKMSKPADILSKKL